jgi:type I restriction enzyme R subunit
MNKPKESDTRKTKINPMLAAAGWNILPYDKKKELNDYNNCAIKEYPTDFGHADYALCTGGKILGVIEAKKEGYSIQSVLTQSERYSR